MALVIFVTRHTSHVTRHTSHVTRHAACVMQFNNDGVSFPHHERIKVGDGSGGDDDD